MVIRKSAKQVEREAARQRDREARQAAQAQAEVERETVRVYVGEPFAPGGGEVDVASASSFIKPERPPAFELTGRQRQELLRRDRPRIVFPKDEPCPISVGEVYPITSQLALVVTGISEGKTEFELLYQLLDERAHNLGKVADYASSSRASIATQKAVEEVPLTGPQFRPETEPEAVSKKEQIEMSNEDRTARIERLKKSRHEIRENLDALRDVPGTSSARWAGKRAVEAITKRIEHEERGLGKPLPEAA